MRSLGIWPIFTLFFLPRETLKTELQCSTVLLWTLLTAKTSVHTSMSRLANVLTNESYPILEPWKVKQY